MVLTEGGWMDISEPISKSTIVWPGDPQAIITQVASFDIGDNYQLSEAFLNLHTGTHVDAPLHFIKEGKDVSQIRLETMMGEAKVLDASALTVISADWLMTKNLRKGDRLLFKTMKDNDIRQEKLSQMNFIALDVDAAYYLTELGIVLAGIDGLSIAKAEELNETHQVLLKNEIVIVEVLNLTGIQEGNYEMICLPIKIEGAEAAPARVLLRQL
ncbi:MAG: cyclase family protein [Bacteroidetes bacterium]|nr:cyclase family protein [Bacteroidota bacterium]